MNLHIKRAKKNYRLWRKDIVELIDTLEGVDENNIDNQDNERVIVDEEGNRTILKVLGQITINR